MRRRFWGLPRHTSGELSDESVTTAIASGVKSSHRRRKIMASAAGHERFVRGVDRDAMARISGAASKESAD